MLTSTAFFPTSRKLQPGTQTFDCDGIQVIALPVGYAHMMPFGKRIRSFLQFYRQALATARQLPKPDLIYASSTPLTVGELGRKLARRWQIPFVFEVVDVWPDVPIGMGIVRNRLLIKWLHRRTDKIYREAAAIVALSPGMKAQILLHGVPPAKVHVSYNGTNLGAFSYVARPPRDTVHVIYTGTVGLANGADVIPRLCERLQALGRTDLRVTIVGGGNDLARVQRQAEALGLRNLQFVASVPKEQVPDLLAGADIGLVTFAPFPVLEANSANKFYDYLASGLPVLINYGGWQAAMLQENACGLSAAMGDLEALVQHVIRLADDPALRRAMGERGRALAESQFDRVQIAGSLLQLFGDVQDRPVS